MPTSAPPETKLFFPASSPAVELVSGVKDMNLQRHLNYGLLSPLTHFKMTGMEVDLPNNQRRMSRGLSNDVAKTIYPDLPRI